MEGLCRSTVFVPLLSIESLRQMEGLATHSECGAGAAHAAYQIPGHTDPSGTEGGGTDPRNACCAPQRSRTACGAHRCDNCLLEARLALDLEERPNSFKRSCVRSIFPVFVGSQREGADQSRAQCAPLPVRAVHGAPLKSLRCARGAGADGVELQDDFFTQLPALSLPDAAVASRATLTAHSSHRQPPHRRIPVPSVHGAPLASPVTVRACRRWSTSSTS